MWPRSRILLIGPPDCGQSLIVDRLADRLGQSPQVLSLEAWATVPPADQWAALDAWAAAGSYLVVRHADGFSAASAGLATDAVTRRFLAWCGTAPRHRLYVVRDVPARSVARAVLDRFPDW